MYDYTIFQWLLFLYIYCFLGWIWESSYDSIKAKKFINRGFLSGPFLPIYGTGAIMMLVVSAPFRDNLILTYFAGVIGATVLELVTGIVMEALFKVRYWDYSSKFCNYKGYICLGSSIAWGFFTIILTRFIHKPIEYLVLGVPQEVINVISVTLTVYIAYDFVLSFHGAFKLHVLLDKMQDVKDKVGVLEERVSNIINFVGGSWLQYVLKRHLHRIKGNPNMVSKLYKGELGDLKKFMSKPKVLKKIRNFKKNRD